MSSDNNSEDLQTELDKAREQIQKLEAEVHMFKSFMQHVPDAVYFKDKDSRFITTSDSLAIKHDLSAEELIGKTDHDLFHPEHADQARADELRVMETGQPLVGAANMKSTMINPTPGALHTRWHSGIRMAVSPAPSGFHMTSRARWNSRPNARN